jgi:3-hydroxyacyl-CoA dehydrogenase/alpha-ketoglutarate-dependent taurine dioxygenase
VSAISGLSTVGLLGGGVIGGGWAARFLLNGVDVKVFDPDPEAPRRVDEVVANAGRAVPALLSAPLPALGTLTFVPTIADAVTGVDFVQESGPERLELKQELLAAADAAADPGVVIGSSTSGLLPTKLQAAMEHPGRLVVGHPFNPVYLLPLVEVCGGERTSPSTIARAVDVYGAVGMRPLELDAEIDGFVADRLLEALWREALWLVRDGFATAGQVDDAIRFGAGLRWSAMGTFLVYRIAGGEAGMRHFMAQFGPALEWPWSRLTDVPDLTDELLDRLVTQSDEQAEGRSIRELEMLRDDCLVAVMRGLRDVGFGAGEVVADYERVLVERAAGGGVSVEWDGSAIPAFWLRDNCPCAACVHPQTRERLLDTFALDPHVEAVTVTAGGDGLTVDWSDGHRSEYPTAWLRVHGSLDADLPAPRLWDATLAATLPEFEHFEYDDVVSDADGLRRFVETVWTVGIAFVRNAPTVEETTRDLARRVGPIRPTNFGAEFHVEAKPDPNNVAYTAVELRPHTDLPYHENPPGIQFLHCFAADAAGGESTFVDGFWVAERIRRDDPAAFRLLCDVAIPYRFHDEAHDLRFAAPVITCEPDGRYREVRFHDALTAPLDLAGSSTDATYRALRSFDRLARTDEAQLTVRLQPGDVVVFRNRRVLHGRRAFAPGSGVRRLFGLYVDDDAWRSRFRNLGAAAAR